MAIEGLFEASEFSKECYKIYIIRGRDIRLRNLI